MIDTEKLLKYLGDRKNYFDICIAENNESIKSCAPDNSEKMRVHMEIIGKLRARINECNALVYAINNNEFKK